MEEEYEIQHYNFTIAELKKESETQRTGIVKENIKQINILTATDMVHGEVDKACASLVSSIVTSPEVEDAVAAEIDRKKNILANDIKELLKDSLDEMGNIMTEHFSIPPNVTLGTDDQFKLRCMNVSEQKLEAELNEHLAKFMMVCIGFSFEFFFISFKTCLLTFSCKNTLSFLSKFESHCSHDI